LQKEKKEISYLVRFFYNKSIKKNGHLNFWVNTKHYNILEIVHHTWLLAVANKAAKIKI
jgi:hypothetical protein